MLGPGFGGGSKSGLSSRVGLEGVHRAHERSRKPIVAWQGGDGQRAPDRKPRQRWVGCWGRCVGGWGRGLAFMGVGGRGTAQGGAMALGRGTREYDRCGLVFCPAWLPHGKRWGGSTSQVPLMQGLVVRPLDDWSIRDSFSDHLAWTAASERAQNKPSMKAMFVEVNALQELLSVIDPRNILEQAQKFAQQHAAMQAQVMRGAVVEHEGLQAMAAPKKWRQLALPAPPAGEPGVMQAALPDGKA